MRVIVGGIIEKEGKFLLVQEAKKNCYEKWNIPAGHLEFNEAIKNGAIREVKEETGLDVELTGIASVVNKLIDDDILAGIIFYTKIINEEIHINRNEILDAKWFSYEDIMYNMEEQLRDKNFIQVPIKNFHNGIKGDMELLSII